MLSPLIKKAMPQTTLFSGKRVRRGPYKTNRRIILCKECPSAFDGQELSYLYEPTKVVSYTDIYIGAKSLCNERYTGKNHQSGIENVNHQKIFYRKIE